MIQFYRPGTSLTTPLRYYILQDSKRLRTFQVPQEREIPPVPEEDFNHALLYTLIRLQTAFEKLQKEQPANSPSSIKNINLKGVSGLQVESGQGWFLFEGKSELCTFFYTSPFNGVFKYYLDLKTQEWKSNKDDHIMVENLAREIQGKFHSYFDI